VYASLRDETRKSRTGRCFRYIVCARDTWFQTTKAMTAGYDAKKGYATPVPLRNIIAVCIELDGSMVQYGWDRISSSADVIA